MSEQKEREIRFEIVLPYEFRIVNYGSDDTVELEMLKEDVERGTKKKLGTKSWKFVGYYTNAQGALKGYLKRAPMVALKGKVELSEVVKVLKEIEDIVDNISRDY